MGRSVGGHSQPELISPRQTPILTRCGTSFAMVTAQSAQSSRSNVNGMREAIIREVGLAWCTTTLMPMSA